jgi:hypothetical protein
MALRKKQIFQYIFIFLFFVIFIVIGQKLFGDGAIGKVGPLDPLSWNDILHELPSTILISLLIVIFMAWTINKKEKIDSKKHNENDFSEDQ